MSKNGAIYKSDNRSSVREYNFNTDEIMKFAAQMQPDPVKRELVMSSLRYYLIQNNINFHNITNENRMMLLRHFLQLGIQVSADTVYPITFNDGKALILQDNYEFLREQIIKVTGAAYFEPEVFYGNEYANLADLRLKPSFKKCDVLGCSQFSHDQTYRNITHVIVALVGKDEEYPVAIFTKEYLLLRVGRALTTGRIWKVTDDSIDAPTGSGNSKTEMLKKTAIRAYAKRYLGRKSQLIRDLDIAESEMRQQFSEPAGQVKSTYSGLHSIVQTGVSLDDLVAAEQKAEEYIDNVAHITNLDGV